MLYWYVLRTLWVICYRLFWVNVSVSPSVVKHLTTSSWTDGTSEVDTDTLSPKRQLEDIYQHRLTSQKSECNIDVVEET